MAGITIDRVDLTAAPPSIKCPPSNPKTKFTVTVTVIGQGGQLPGAYDVKLYDIDSSTSKTLLDENLNVAVAAHLNFTTPHTFELWCDDLCEVQGRLGNSREMKPELKAIVYYQINLEKASPVESPIQCGSGNYMPGEKKLRDEKRN